MKKITLLCLASERDETLHMLQDLGILHLTPIQPPQSGELEKAKNRLAYVRRALEVMPHSADKTPTSYSAEEIVDKVWALLQERKDLEHRRELLRHEFARIEPFGSFDPQHVLALKEKGLFIKLYQMSPKDKLPVLEGAAVHELRRDKRGVYFCVISADDVSIGVQEVRLPSQSPRALEEQIKKIEDVLKENKQTLDAYRCDRKKVVDYSRQLANRVHFLEAQAGMGLSKPVAYIQGYCPTDTVKILQQKVKELGCALLVSDPAAGETVPTLIRYSRWVKPIKVVLDAIGILPGYEEIDIGPVFLLFLSVFFAMLVGDAGYGLVFFGLTWWARRKFPLAPSQPFALLRIMSLCTIIWGVATGSYFGASNLPAFLKQTKVDWLGNEQHIMLLCFLIGAIHLTVAHLWNALRSMRSLQALAQLGWVCMTWTMFFMARSLVLAETVPAFVLPLFAVGLIAIILFMTPLKNLKSEWFNHVMLPLSLVSNFVDVVSYLRLFAVGTASFAVAASFNQMALSHGIHNVVGGLVAALILFLGHALNILLSAMSVLVHGVRLNTLEFSSHIGVQWAGSPYKPFAKNADIKTVHE